jgi:rhodanese-related sulfurtransferase
LQGFTFSFLLFSAKDTKVHDRGVIPKGEKSRKMSQHAPAVSQTSKPSQTWRVAIRQTIGIVLVAIAVGLTVNQLRSDRLPLIADWSPEARLTLKLDNKALIPFEEARDAFLSGSAVFIDARPADEYRKGHIQGARNLYVGVFDEKAGEVLLDLPEDTLIVTYCDGERCALSVDLALKLKEIGYENVRVLVNGWSVWKSHQLPSDSVEHRDS